MTEPEQHRPGHLDRFQRLDGCKVQRGFNSFSQRLKPSAPEPLVLNATRQRDVVFNDEVLAQQKLKQIRVNVRGFVNCGGPIAVGANFGNTRHQRFKPPLDLSLNQGQ